MRRSSQSEKFWAIVRLILGSFQILTSSMALVFVMNLGTHPVAICVAAAACGCSLTSQLLAMRLWFPNQH